MTQSLTIIIVDKSGTLKTLTVKDYKVEDLFKINIHIYTQDDKEHAEIDRRNKGKYD